MRIGHRRLAATCALLLAAFVSGCTTLPDHGAVFTRPDTSADVGTEASYFAPPGPVDGAARDDVVRGFLLAMQANPPSTAVARQFLSQRSRTSWKPVEGTIVYDASTVEATTDTIYARLSDAHRLDPQGGWVGGTAGSTLTVPFSLVSEGGQWRIDNPPNALAVPASYFSSLFVPFVLYFFDHTGTVLIPTRVYLPRGEQTASNLVRGLLAGPPPALGEAAVNAFGPHTSLDLGVVVNDAGVAEVPLGPEVERLSAGDLERAVLQLAWTLRQVPGINRVRITVDGTSVPLPNGQTDVNVNEGPEVDPTSARSRTVVALAGQKVVQVDGSTATPVGGPFGRTGFALRSVALDGVTHQIAAVALNGHRLYLAPDHGPADEALVTSALPTGENLLRPVFDRFGGLWAIDATRRGAVVHLIAGGRDRVLRVPGISGQPVTSFTVTRDGARLIAGLGTVAPTLVVSTLVRGGRGRLTGVLPGVSVAVPDSDPAAISDVGQNSATTVAVLLQPDVGSGRIVTVEVDGSPGILGASTPVLVPGRLVQLVTGPDPALAVQVVTSDHRLIRQSDGGTWIRTLGGILAAAYQQ